MVSTRWKNGMIIGIGLAAVAVSLASAQPTVRDSAGIRIYDYRSGPIPTAFVVNDSPVVRFFSPSQDSISPLFSSAITRLRNGDYVFGTSSTTTRRPNPLPQVPAGAPPPQSIVLPSSVFQRDASWQNVIDLRIFDSTGTFLRRIGHAGAGPTEFPGTPTVMVESPDKRLLVGTALPGYRAVTPDGTISAVPASVAFGKLIGVFSDGSTLVSRLGTIWPVHPAITDSVLQLKNETTGYVRISADGNSTVQLPITTRSLFFENMPGNAAPVPNLPWPYWTSYGAHVGADVIWLFNPYTWEIQCVDRNGVIKAITRAPMPHRAQEARLGGRFPRAESYNVETFADNSGRLWIDSGDNNRPAISDTTRRDYLVFANTGEMLGRVLMPNGFRPMSVRDDVIIGPWHPRFNVTRFPAAFRFRK